MTKDSSDHDSTALGSDTVIEQKQVEHHGMIAPPQSKFRRNLTLFICCFAMFFDTFNSGGAVICLNAIRDDFHVTADKVQWVLTAYSLTYGAFMLLSGKLSDMYHPKPVFIIGFVFVGAFSIGAGFVHNFIGLVILRALAGIGAAMTVPSATHMIDSLFSDPKSKGIALTLFGGAGTMGSIVGFVVSGVVVEFATWRWVFWLIAIGTLPVAVLSFWIIKADSWTVGKRKNIDAVGVFTLTVAIILLIFALSEAPSNGWGSASTLAPLIIGLAMVIGFFFWEAKMDQDLALIPSYLWFIPNLTILSFIAFVDLIYFSDAFVLFSNYWGFVFGWNEFHIALHFLPLGVMGGLVCIVGAVLILALPPKFVLSFGQLLAGLATLLFVFGGHRADYFRLILPAMILVPLGGTSTYLVANVTIITSLPPAVVGVGSAIFNAAAQIGLAVNIAIITTIQTSIDGPLTVNYKGTRSAFIYIVALGCVSSVIAAIFFKTPKKAQLEDGVVPAVAASEPEQKTEL